MKKLIAVLAFVVTVFLLVGLSYGETLRIDGRAAIDPISTAKIEELIINLKRSITIVIVTHNMQHAARISDYAAFMCFGGVSGVWEHTYTIRKSQE